ncbi:MAG: NnrS family protein [Campylobacteraceae bacterium]|nr:NnrS family protein [Campylobacteraceae bacterium]
MAFVSSLTPPQAPKTTPLQNLVAMPHRLFFFAGIVQGLLLMLLLGLQYGLGFYLHVNTFYYHVFGMSFVVFTQFFVGFLLTTFPRYLARPSPAKESYFLAAISLNIGGLCLILAGFFWSGLLWPALILVFAGYAKLFWELVKLQLQSIVANKTDTSWLLGAFALGGIGQILFMINPFLPVKSLATGVSFYLYLFLVVMVVSQKMIPFFAANVLQGYVVKKSHYFLHSIFAGLLAKVILQSMELNTLLADLFLLVVLAYELLRWNLPFRNSPPILWVLFLSIWWTPVGFFLFSLDGIFKALNIGITLGHAPLHALALGYFTTILIGFGTRVLLGHSGREPTADKYTVMLFMLIQVMVVVRIFADLFSSFYIDQIVVTLFLWLAVFGWWSGRYAKILFEK